MNTKEKLILTGVVAGLALAVVFLDYKVWRLQHPQAPAWTYLLGD